ncbi:MAG: hypothetical protein HY711_06190 [Candidatus Melainabacteria bacterium]|nr:hypothetical protein [Candidatus Melainabacteria bacterium]
MVPIGCEAQPSRFPCQRFFVANRQLFLNSGLPEYGAIGSYVSLTVLRSVSQLSRGRLRTRGGGAGPHIDTPGALCLGKNHVRYGWAPLKSALTEVERGGSRGELVAAEQIVARRYIGSQRSSEQERHVRSQRASFTPGGAAESGDGGLNVSELLSDKTIAEAYQLAEQFEGCLWAALAFRSTEKSSHCLIRMDNPSVRISALYCSKEGEEVFLRLLNLTSSVQVVCVSTEFPWQSIERCLLSEAQRSSEGLVILSDGSQFELTMTPNELATLMFRF